MSVAEMRGERYEERPADPSGYKSRAEVQIAGLLGREGVAYRYEHPLAVIDQGKTRIWYPDFYLSEYGMIIEYFGVNRDAGYDKRTEHKIQVYRNNGIDGVFLTEDTLKRQWPTGIIRRIEDILERRLQRFDNRPRHLQEKRTVSLVR